MRTPLAALVLLAASPLAAEPAPAQKIADVAPYLMDRAAEVALARSAAPAHVSDAATVLALAPNGYVEAARGTNGFTCLVARSFAAGLDDPAFWNTRVRAPHCLNPAAVRTILPEMRKRAEWVLAGVSRDEIGARTKRAYASQELPLPGPGAMAYMLSHQQHLLDSDPHWMPHLMFYYDRSQPASAWGAAGPTAPVIDGSAGDPQSPVLVLFVPVRQWSDGSPAVGHP
jgi:hypothetical protein